MLSISYLPYQLMRSQRKATHKADHTIHLLPYEFKTDLSEDHTWQGLSSRSKGIIQIKHPLCHMCPRRKDYKKAELCSRCQIYLCAMAQTQWALMPPKTPKQNKAKKTHHTTRQTFPKYHWKNSSDAYVRHIVAAEGSGNVLA